MNKITKFFYEIGDSFKALFQSKLALKVLVVNLIGPLALFVGMIISDNYEKTLINSEAEHLFARSEQIVNAIKQNALEIEYVTINDPQKSLDIEAKKENPVFTPNSREVSVVNGGNYDALYKISADDTRFILKNYIGDKSVRYRVFGADGTQKADSKYVLPFDFEEEAFPKEKQYGDLLRYIITTYKNFRNNFV